jgi:hypothetical protein
VKARGIAGGVLLIVRQQRLGVLRIELIDFAKTSVFTRGKAIIETTHRHDNPALTNEFRGFC